MWPWQEGGDERALPRWYHWLIAIMLLFGVMLVTPIFATFA